MGGIWALAEGVAAEFKDLLYWQCKAPRDNFAPMIATMLQVRSSKLVDLAAQPREMYRTDMRDGGSAPPGQRAERPRRRDGAPRRRGAEARRRPAGHRAAP